MLQVVKEWAENRYQAELQLTSAALDELKTNLSLEVVDILIRGCTFDGLHTM